MSFQILVLFVFGFLQLGLGCHPNMPNVGNPTSTTPPATTTSTIAPVTLRALIEIPLCVESGGQSTKYSFQTQIKNCKISKTPKLVFATFLRTDESGKPICKSEELALVDGAQMSPESLISPELESPSIDCDHPESFCTTPPNKMLLKYSGSESEKFVISKLQFNVNGQQRKTYSFPTASEETKTQWIGIEVWSDNCNVGEIDQFKVYTAYYLVENGKGITRVFNEEEKKKFLAGDVNAGKKPCEMDVCMA